jgi:outer membrane protein OmpA-like peptidoglycan-associated protein
LSNGQRRTDYFGLNIGDHGPFGSKGGTVLDSSGPVSAFLEATQARDVNRLAGLLAHDVRLSVPPLHYTRFGSQDVVAAVTGLYAAFDELGYEVRSRYLAPGTVTDEAVLIGRQTGPFLGAEPRRQRVGVPARVIVTHDSALVTAVTLWPDLAALRTAVAGVSRLIDLTKVGEAGDMVAALRASIPPGQTKVIIGTARREPVVTATIAPELSLPVSDGPVVGRAVPRAPVPRSIQRRRGLLVGCAMLVASAAMTTWVAIGALGTGDAARSGADPAASGPVDGHPDPAGSGSGPAPGDAAGNAAAPIEAGTVSDGAPTLTRETTMVTIDAKLLFEVDSAAFTPQARSVLDDLIAAALAQHRRGQAIVRGYTDDTGGDAYNLKLSQRRAAAVARALRVGLGPAGLTFTSRGYGEADPRVPNDSPAHRRQNRRVVVIFPAISG